MGGARIRAKAAPAQYNKTDKDKRRISSTAVDRISRGFIAPDRVFLFHPRLKAFPRYASPVNAGFPRQPVDKSYCG